MGLSPFVRSVLGGSRFPQLVGQELPKPVSIVSVKETTVNTADSASEVKPGDKPASGVIKFLTFFR